MLARVEGAVGLVTFNNPEKRNAVTVEMMEALAEIMERMETDPTVRVVVITGAGDKSFVSGADIGEFEKRKAASSSPDEWRKRTRGGYASVGACSKPVVARIRGFCLGGGLGLATLADLRVASDDSQFGVPTARLGNIYPEETVRRLMSLVGPAHARMLLYTGSRISAAEAERIGLINRMVPAADLDAVVMDIARTIGENAPLSVKGSKVIVSEMLKDSERRDKEAIEQARMACFSSADFKEGRAAFLEKRKPKFTGA